MHTFIALSVEERATYCRQAAETLPYPIPAAAIEKDFWVSWLLQVLMEHPLLRGHLTFKGGTSLSKAYGIIDRFSEDIDLVLDRALLLPGEATDPGTLSNSQRKRYLDRLSERCTAWTSGTLLPALQARLAELLPNDSGWALTTVCKGNETNLVFSYPGGLQGELGSLLPHVLVELVPRADDEPNAHCGITSLVHQALPEALGPAMYHVPTLAPERTLLEKAMLLHETVTGHQPGSERKSRHYYDLMKLNASGYGAKAMADTSLLSTVVEHRRTFYRYNQMDYNALLREGITIVPPTDHLPDWRGDYIRTSAMIYRDPPTFDELMAAARRFQEAFNHWVRNSKNG
jgi:hypothetical protein